MIQDFQMAIALMDRAHIKVNSITVDKRSHNELMMSLWENLTGTCPPPGSSFIIPCSHGDVLIKCSEKVVDK